MKKLFKRFLLLSVLSLIIVSFAACGNVTEDEAPVINGVDNVTIELGSQFVPLAGVSVTDKEDGTISSDQVIVNAKSLNPNVEGVYDVTYSVSDSFGNTTTVTRKVTVVYTDTVVPTLYGVSDKEIIVGDANFTVLEGVSAIDNIDGDITKNINVTGSVNVWKLGEQTVNYKVTDVAGNEATAVRKITVGLGEYKFSEENLVGSVYNGISSAYTPEGISLQINNVTGGTFDSQFADFALVKLNVKLHSTTDCKIEVTLTDGLTSSDAIEVVASANPVDCVKYFRVTKALENASFGITIKGEAGSVTFDSIEVVFATVQDNIAPEVTIADNVDVIVPVGISEAAAIQELIRGVSAVDNMAGNISSKVYAELGDVDLSKPGTFVVKVCAKDEFNNVGFIERNIVVTSSYELAVLKDAGFNGTEVPADWKIAKNANGSVTMYVEDGVLKVNVVTPGAWSSGDSPYLSGLTTAVLKAGEYYAFKVDVKAEKERKMDIRAGLELWTDPWIENFSVGKVRYTLTTEWQTIYFIFYVENDASAVGSNNIKFEIQLGVIDSSDNEKNNIIEFDNAQFYKLTNVNEAPVITKVEDAKTTYAKTDAAPDFKSLVKVNDLEDGDIVVTDDMINVGDFSMATPGTYDIIYTVKDSQGKETVFTLKVIVIEEEDKVAPVASIAPEAIATINAMMPIKQGTNIENQLITLLGYVSIVDDVDGAIPLDKWIIDYNGMNVKAVDAGTYKVKVSAKDSSGNLSNELEVTVTVSDNEAPKIIGAMNKTLFIDDMFNPMAGITTLDNVDGTGVVVLDNISGLEQFLDNTGKVITKGEFQVVYEVADKAGNTTTKSIAVKVVDKIDFVEDAPINIFDYITSYDGFTSSGSTGKVENGQLVVNYVPNPAAAYASGVQVKCYNNIPLVSGKTYKLVVEASAKLPRDILINFFIGDWPNDVKVTGFANADDYNRLRVGVQSSAYVYEYIFTVENENASFASMEIQLSYEETLANAMIANDITFKQIKLYSTEGVIPVVSEKEPFVYDNFDSYADKDALVAAGWVKRYGGVNYTEGFDLVNVEGNKVVEFTFANDNQYIFRNSIKTPIDAAYKYFRFKVQTTAEKMNLWWYWNGGQNGYTVTLADILYSDGYCYYKVSDTGKQTEQMTTIGLAFNYASGDKAYFDCLEFVTSIPEGVTQGAPKPIVKEPFVYDNFDSYADKDALVAAGWVKRYGGVNYTEGFDLVNVEGNKVVEFTFASNNQFIFKNSITSPIDADYKYFRFKVQTTAEKMNLWWYWNGGQNGFTVTLADILYSDGYCYYKVSDTGKQTEQMTALGLAFNYATGDKAYFDCLEFVASIPDGVTK